MVLYLFSPKISRRIDANTRIHSQFSVFPLTELCTKILYISDAHSHTPKEQMVVPQSIKRVWCIAIGHSPIPCPAQRFGSSQSNSLRAFWPVVGPCCHKGKLWATFGWTEKYKNVSIAHPLRLIQKWAQEKRAHEKRAHVD